MNRPGRLNPAPALWAIVYAMVLVLTAFTFSWPLEPCSHEPCPVHRDALRPALGCHYRWRCRRLVLHGTDVMPVHPDTIGDGGVVGFPMAILGVSPSSIVVHDEHQKGGAVTGHASRRLPHARFEFGRCPSSARRRPVRGSSQVTTRIGHPIHAIRLQSGRAQSLADQLRSQFVADPVIHHRPFQYRFVRWLRQCQQARTKNWEFRTKRSRTK